MAIIPKYADEAAFPQEKQQTLDGKGLLPAQWGLTKREYMATQIAAGICSTGPGWPSSSDGYAIAERAVDIADALLAALERNSR